MVLTYIPQELGYQMPKEFRSFFVGWEIQITRASDSYWLKTHHVTFCGTAVSRWIILVTLGDNLPYTLCPSSCNYNSLRRAWNTTHHRPRLGPYQMLSPHCSPSASPRLRWSEIPRPLGREEGVSTPSCAPLPPSLACLLRRSRKILQ